MDQSINFNIDEVKNDTDAELLKKLKVHWNYNPSSGRPFKVIGQLLTRLVSPKDFGIGKTTTLYFLTNLRSAEDFEKIGYPYQNTSLIRDEVFIPPHEGNVLDGVVEKSDWLVASVRLSPKKERDKHQNPFGLATVGRPDVLKELPGEVVIFNTKGDKKYIEQNIVDFHVNNNRDRIEKESQKLKQEVDSQSSILQNRINDLADEKTTLASEVNSKNSVKDGLVEEISLLNQSVNNKKSELNGLEDNYSSRVAQMESNLSRLNDFVTEKAEKLLKLDLISDSDLKQLLGNMDQHEKMQTHVSFIDNFSSDFGAAIKYIQSFLHKKDIYYKQDLLSDFFAMLRTNDLIILAGDSGSGKTNLVKSMAQAIGGKSVIIPVKPNWTSSEDLLGYYNPLEKKYLSTPFLDALIEASQNPDTPYLICLDEMNLARVEYYFADFLSLLEERSELPDIYLYSDAEADHTLSEFKTFLRLIDDVKLSTGKENIDDYLGLLKDEEVNEAIHKICGFNSGDSLIKYHSHLRRILSGFLNTPSSIKFPANVRIIGSINVDETTHYLSPKILDRAHVIRFGSPLLYDWSAIENEIEDFDDVDAPLLFEMRDLGIRAQYPRFDRSDEFAQIIIDITGKFLNKLGVEIGFRTVRQALNYRNELKHFGINEKVILNNFILHKILPKLMFDGEQISGEVQKKNVLEAFRNHIAEILAELEEQMSVDYCINDLDRVIENAKANNWVVNYWSK